MSGSSPSSDSPRLYRRRQSLMMRKALSSRAIATEYPMTEGSRSASFTMRNETERRRSSGGGGLTPDHVATDVRFSTITILELPVELGDNPSVSSGAPLTLGWDLIRESTFELEFYELHRPLRRTSRRSLLIGSNAREKFLLRNGYELEEIQKAAVEARHIKRERHETTVESRLTINSMCSPPMVRRSRVQQRRMLANSNLRIDFDAGEDETETLPANLRKFGTLDRDGPMTISPRGTISPTSVISAFDRHAETRQVKSPQPPIRVASPAMGRKAPTPYVPPASPAEMMGREETKRREVARRESPPSSKRPSSDSDLPICAASRCPPIAPVRMASPLVSGKQQQTTDLASRMRSTLPPPPVPSPGSPSLRKCARGAGQRRMC